MKRMSKNLLPALFLCVMLCACWKPVAAAGPTPPAANPEKTETAANSLRRINGKLYYYDSKGKRIKNSLKKAEGKYYFFDAKGRAVTNKWKKINGKKYYFKKNGAAATESCKIEGAYYVFNQKGQLLTPRKTSRKKVNDSYYYVNPKGRPVPGWHTLDRETSWDTDVFYVRKNGKCAADETVEGVRFGSDAYAENRDQALAKAAAKDFIRRHTKSGDSPHAKLQKCAWRVVATFSYTGSKRCKGFDKSDWVYRAALEAILTESGDCYYLAATIGAIADALGYQNVSVIHLAIGHGYVRIGTKGNYIFYDNMGPVYGGKKPRYPNGKVKRVFTF